jgi:hypothetical protein
MARCLTAAAELSLQDSFVKTSHYFGIHLKKGVDLMSLVLLSCEVLKSV